jgi:alanyl-tRNA synthetase
VRAVYDHRPFDELKALAMRVAGREKTVVLLGNKVEKGQLAFACSAGLAWRMNDLLHDACTILGGSGGGSPGLAFGSGPLVQKVEEAIQYTYERILRG